MGFGLDVGGCGCGGGWVIGCCCVCTGIGGIGNIIIIIHTNIIPPDPTPNINTTIIRTPPNMPNIPMFLLILIQLSTHLLQFLYIHIKIRISCISLWLGFFLWLVVILTGFLFGSLVGVDLDGLGWGWIGGFGVGVVGVGSCAAVVS